MISAVHLWAVLAAPVCGLFAAQAATSAKFAEARALSPAGMSNTAGETPREAHVDIGPRERSGLMLLVAAGASVAALLAPTSLAACGDVLLCATLGYLAIVDLRLMVVPVRLTLALALAGLVVSGLSLGWTTGIWRGVFALGAWAAFRGLDLGYQMVKRRSGLGAGDALVAAAITGWLGIEGLSWSVAIGCLMTLALILVRARPPAPNQAFALAPGLAAGAFIVLVATQNG